MAPIIPSVGELARPVTDTHTYCICTCTNVLVLCEQRHCCCYYDSLTFDKASCPCTQNHTYSTHGIMMYTAPHNVCENYTSVPCTAQYICSTRFMYGHCFDALKPFPRVLLNKNFPTLQLATLCTRSTGINSHQNLVYLKL